MITMLKEFGLKSDLNRPRLSAATLRVRALG